MSKVKKSPQKKRLELDVTPVKDVMTTEAYVIYGRSGTGKTTLAGSFPKPLLVIDVSDEGVRSISDLEDVFVKRVRSVKEIDEVYWYLKENPDEYSTIVIDTVSQLQQMVVNEVAGETKGKDAGAWGSMSQAKWAEVASETKSILIDFRDLAINGTSVVFIAQDRENRDEGTDGESLALEVGPALSPSVAKTLNGAVSVIAHTFIRTTTTKKRVGGKLVKKTAVEFCLRVGPNSTYITKVRKPKGVDVPEVIVDPDYEDLMSIIEGS